MIRLVTDFECGNGKNVEQLAENSFRLEVDGDKQTGYGSYFCFDLINEGLAAEVTIELREDSRWGVRTGFGSVFPTTLWIKPVEFHRFRPLRGQHPECIDGKATFKVPVEENQRLRVAMTYVAPYSAVRRTRSPLSARTRRASLPSGAGPTSSWNVWGSARCCSI